MSSSNARLIDEVIDIARGVSFPGRFGREQRDTARLPFNGMVAYVRITPVGELAPPVLLAAGDISVGGMCVRSPETLPVGSRGAVLVSRSNGEPVVLAAKVVHCNQVGTCKFECGLEFEVALPAATIRDFHDGDGKLPDVARAA